jgi:hypothetical protein
MGQFTGTMRLPLKQPRQAGVTHRPVEGISRTRGTRRSAAVSAGHGDVRRVLAAGACTTAVFEGLPSDGGLYDGGHRGPARRREARRRGAAESFLDGGAVPAAGG